MGGKLTITGRVVSMENKEPEKLQELIDFAPRGGFCWGMHKYREIPAPSWAKKRAKYLKCEKCGKKKRTFRYKWGMFA